MDARQFMQDVASHVAATQLQGSDAHKKALTSLLRDNAHRHRMHDVFPDFVELSALCFSIAIDKLQAEKRSARFADIAKRYTPEELARFPRMLAVLVLWLQCGHADRLGDLFMSLEIANHHGGQFFTPYEVSSLMAGLTLGDIRAQVKQQGFLLVNEPACGSGGMVIACADAIRAQGLQPHQVMHVTAVDIDVTAVHMTYLQLSLLGIPAIVIHGNTLTVDERAHWVTPAHVLERWDLRLRMRRIAEIIGSLSAGEPPQENETASVEADAAPQAADPVASASARIVSQRVEQLGLFS